MNKNYLYAGSGIAGVISLTLFLWFFIPRASPSATPTDNNFGVGENRQVTVETSKTPTNTDLPVQSEGIASANKKIFKLLDGPVAGVNLVELGRPTTTIARFVMADSGRVFDLPLGVPGAVPRAVSNTTIPGIANVVWSEKGGGVLLQYLDQGTVKTLHIAFPTATTTLTTSAPAKIQFLPDGITSLAVSPDGSRVAYITKTSNGSAGYVAKADGTGSKKLFSLPLSQALLSWPSAGVLLAQSTPASGVPGVAFSVGATSGVVSPLIYAMGLTAIADRSFSRVVYQTSDGGSRATYARDTKTGNNTPLSFDPFPEQCIWSEQSSVLLLCAAPLTYVAPNYLDLWLAGVASVPDSIFAFNVATGRSNILAVPGGVDGGEPSDIAQLAVSSGDQYVLFIRKGDRSLWGVRLND